MPRPPGSSGHSATRAWRRPESGYKGVDELVVRCACIGRDAAKGFGQKPSWMLTGGRWYMITPDVCSLRDHFRLLGTRVLQFAFDGKSDNPHLPENYTSNTVVYTGTHDNPTIRGWFEKLPPRQKQCPWNYLKQPADERRDAASMLINFGVVM